MPKRTRALTAEASLSARSGEIFEAVAAGATVRELARRFGMNRNMLWRWLRSPANGARYRETLAERADDLISEATALIDSADPTNVGVRREQVRHRQWLASRLDADRFGDRPQSATINVNVTQISAGDALKQIWQTRRAIERTAGAAMPQVEHGE